MTTTPPSLWAVVRRPGADLTEWWVVKDGWHPGRYDLVIGRYGTATGAVERASLHNRYITGQTPRFDRLWPDVVRWAFAEAGGKLYRAVRILQVDRPVLVRWLREHPDVRDEIYLHGK